MRSLLAVLLSWLMPSTGKHRARLAPTQQPLTDEPTRRLTITRSAVGVELPSHRSPRPPVYLRGEDTPLIRPYLIAYEREQDANVTARYSIPVGDGEFFVYTDWAYRSKVLINVLYESKEYVGKPWVIGGLRVGYDWDGGRYEVAAFARNITNQIRVTGAIDFNNLTGFINDPRTFGVQFKATF